MATLAVVLSAITLLAVLILFFRLFGRREDKREEPGLLLLQKEVSDLRSQLDSRLGQMDRSLGERLSGTAQLFGDVKEGLGKLAQASQQIYDLGKDISGLQDILKPPKLRGILGEVFLHDLLALCLPPNCFVPQHRFKDGTVVDAVICLPGGLVPVDAKFPLDRFQAMLGKPDEERARERRQLLRETKKMVDDIRQKYIQPAEGTLDFALMYIPAESVFYEVIARPDPDEEGLQDYALRQRVIPVSPTTFYACLQSISLGLKGLQIEQHAREVFQELSQLHQRLNSFAEDFDTLGTHLRRAQGKYDEADKKLARLGDHLERLETAELSLPAHSPAPRLTGENGASLDTPATD